MLGSLRAYLVAFELVVVGRGVDLERGAGALPRLLAWVGAEWPLGAGFFMVGTEFLEALTLGRGF